MLLIFYLLVLMPMRRRQRKIQDFQAALKVGDKVVTTGGIYGQVTEVREKDAAVQIQIADKVRIDVSRAAIGGYQGQDPVVQAESTSSSNCSHVQESSLEDHSPSSSSPVWRCGRSCRRRQKVKLGLDLKGGVHLVLKVKTDDALKAETETASEQFQEALKTAPLSRVGRPRDEPQRVRRRGRARRSTTRSSAQLADTQLGHDVRSRVGRRRDVHVPDEAERRSARRAKTRSRRRSRRSSAGSTSSASSEPIVAPYGTTGDQIVVQLPGVDDINRAKNAHSADGAARHQAGRGRARRRTRSRCSRPHNGVLPPDLEVVPGVSRRHAATRSRVFYLVRRVSAITGRGSSQRQADASTSSNLPAVSFTLNSEGVGQVQRGRPKRTSARSSRSCSTTPCARRRSSRARSRRPRRGSPGRFTQQEAQDLSLVLRSGALPASLDLSRAARGRSVARRGLDPRRHPGVARRPRVRRAVHARRTTSWPASTRS